MMMVYSDQEMGARSRKVFVRVLGVLKVLLTSLQLSLVAGKSSRFYYFAG